MKDRIWVQAAIDVTDLELAKKIAFMALDNGADWLEIGTPLLYTYGHKAIGEIRRAVGKDVPLVADYKSPFAALCVPQAAEQGIDYVMLSPGYNDWALSHSIHVCKEYEVDPIFDMNVKPEDLPAQIEKLVKHGAKYIFTRHYSAVLNDDGELVKTNNFPGIMLPDKQYFLGITSDDLEEAKDSIACGADWITFGWVLRNADAASCRHWINELHEAGYHK